MNIQADGIYHLDKHSLGRSVVYVSGTLGGGTASLGYGKDGEVFPLLEGILAIDEQYLVEHGNNMDIYLTLVGSSGADLDVVCRGIG